MNVECTPETAQRFQALFEKEKAIEVSDGGDLTMDGFVVLLLDIVETEFAD